MQKNYFLCGEGDNWYDRNVSCLDAQNDQKSSNDLILSAIDFLAISSESALEIGCANGWRLEILRQRLGADCHGIDPSSKAIALGCESYRQLNLQQGTADSLPYQARQFDLVMIGFCLYLCDREDIFKIASEVDRVIADNGSIVILDFHAPFPYKNGYSHASDIFSYKMDYARMFSWNPAYNLVFQQVVDHDSHELTDQPDQQVAVSVLQKRQTMAFPDNPYEAGQRVSQS